MIKIDLDFMSFFFKIRMGKNFPIFQMQFIYESKKTCKTNQLNQIPHNIDINTLHFQQVPAMK